FLPYLSCYVSTLYLLSFPTRRSSDLYEAVFGDEPALLGEMVEHRLTAMGLDPESLEWDAWRDSDSPLWTISAQFSTKGLADSSIGDPPPALWTYKLQSKHLENA